MELLDYLKPLLKEEADMEDLEKKLAEAVDLNPEKVKAWVALPENKPVFDHIATKAINSHIEKEKTARAEWEKKREAELREEVKNLITKENQKSPEMMEIEELKKKLAQEQSEKARASLQALLLSIVEKEKLPVPAVDPFLQYGEDAEAKLREFASNNTKTIDDLVKQITAEKFGGGKMPGDKGGSDDKPVPTEDWLKTQGFGSNEN